MEMFYIISICILYISTTCTDACDSDRLFVGSINETYPEHIEKNGIYLRESNDFEGYPMFKHETRDYFLYRVYGNLLSPYWVIGSTPGGLTASISILTQATSPDEVTGHWRLWNAAENAWVEERHLGVTCVDASFITCTSGRLIFEGLSPWNYHQRNRTGTYTLTNITNEFRPVYQHVGRDNIYLYFVNGLWMVGPDIGRVSAAIFSLDYAWRPEYITETWIVFNGMQFLRDTRLKIRCSGEDVELTSGQPAYTEDDIRPPDIDDVILVAEGVLDDTDTQIPVCDVNWCQNGGTCIKNEVNQYMCACYDQYFGSRCEQSLSCGEPPETDNGHVISQTGSGFYNLAFYACAENFHLVGESASMCQENGQWSSAPQCVDWLSLLNPGVPANGGGPMMHHRRSHNPPTRRGRSHNRRQRNMLRSLLEGDV